MFHRNRKKQTQQSESAHVLRTKMLRANSSFAVKEAYNAVRTKLLFTGQGEKCPVFSITSAFSHDGKTTNAVNLAISIATAGKKVLLIDGDLRKPTIHKYFGVESANGLSEVLAGLTREVRIRKTEIANLHVLTSGQIPPNPAELLGSRQMDTLLDYVKKYFDYVLIDTPPVNVVTDAMILAEKVTGYVLVVQSGKNKFKDLSYAIDGLRQMNGNVVGVILNDCSGKGATRFGYRNESSYYRRGGYRRGYREQDYMTVADRSSRPSKSDAGQENSLSGAPMDPATESVLPADSQSHT